MQAGPSVRFRLMPPNMRMGNPQASCCAHSRSQRRCTARRSTRASTNCFWAPPTAASSRSPWWVSPHPRGNPWPGTHLAAPLPRGSMSHWVPAEAGGSWSRTRTLSVASPWCLMARFLCRVRSQLLGRLRAASSTLRAVSPFVACCP